MVVLPLLLTVAPILLLALVLIKGTEVTIRLLKWVLNLRLVHALAIGLVYVAAQHESEIATWAHVLGSQASTLYAQQKESGGLNALPEIRLPDVGELKWPSTFEPAALAPATIETTPDPLPARTINTAKIDEMKLPTIEETEAYHLIENKLKDN